MEDPLLKRASSVRINVPDRDDDDDTATPAAPPLPRAAAAKGKKAPGAFVADNDRANIAFSRAPGTPPVVKLDPALLPRKRGRKAAVAAVGGAPTVVPNGAAQSDSDDADTATAPPNRSAPSVHPYVMHIPGMGAMAHPAAAEAAAAAAAEAEAMNEELMEQRMEGFVRGLAVGVGVCVVVYVAYRMLSGGSTPPVPAAAPARAVAYRG